ncbi:hypothetical protein SAMN05444421_1073 [Celeribacter marinus]|nr:hypothetical protein SAMN05444421_1073 [Celeribacter marinus]
MQTGVLKLMNVGGLAIMRSVCLCFATWCFFPTVSVASDLKVEHHIGSSPEEFLPFELGSNLGFQGEPVWFKITPPEGITASSQVLLVRPVHLDSVQVRVGSPEGVVVSRFGDVITSEQGLISDGYSLILDPKWYGKDLYLEIETKNVLHPCQSQSNKGPDRGVKRGHCV